MSAPSTPHFTHNPYAESPHTTPNHGPAQAEMPPPMAMARHSPGGSYTGTPRSGTPRSGNGSVRGFVAHTGTPQTIPVPGTPPQSQWDQLPPSSRQGCTSSPAPSHCSDRWHERGYSPALSLTQNPADPGPRYDLPGDHAQEGAYDPPPNRYSPPPPSVPVLHSMLREKVSFVELTPSGAGPSRGVQAYVNPDPYVAQFALAETRDLFVAQLPFDMPLDRLHELCVRLGMEMPIIQAKPHEKKGKAYDGCAFVKVPFYYAQGYLERFHKRALFDESGVWVAQSPQELDELTRYCAWMQELPPEQRRRILHRPIPFSAMTAENAKRSFSHM